MEFLLFIICISFFAVVFSKIHSLEQSVNQLVKNKENSPNNVTATKVESFTANERLYDNDNTLDTINSSSFVPVLVLLLSTMFFNIIEDADNFDTYSTIGIMLFTGYLYIIDKFTSYQNTTNIANIAFHYLATYFAILTLCLCYNVVSTVPENLSTFSGNGATVILCYLFYCGTLLFVSVKAVFQTLGYALLFAAGLCGFCLKILKFNIKTEKPMLSNKLSVNHPTR